MQQAIDRRAWRLLPTEQVLWSSKPLRDVPRPLEQKALPLLIAGFAIIGAIFGVLVWVAGLDDSVRPFWVSAYMIAMAIAAWMLPGYWFDACEFVVTDKRALWKRGPIVRSIELPAVTYARVRWHASRTGIGELELVRAVPFGPFSRTQSMRFHSIRSPDAVLCHVRSVSPGPRTGEPEEPITSRLDEGEEILWGGAPEGRSWGWREIVTTLIGLSVLLLAIQSGANLVGILLGLESIGLPVGSTIWTLLFLAILLTEVLLFAIGAHLCWSGLGRAIRLGHQSEYLITSKRVLIRRGRVELSLDRTRIADAVPVPGASGTEDLYLILDGPQGRALADSGALSVLAPAREPVPPVFFGLRDASRVVEILCGGPRQSDAEHGLHDARHIWRP